MPTNGDQNDPADHASNDRPRQHDADDDEQAGHEPHERTVNGTVRQSVRPVASEGPVETFWGVISVGRTLGGTGG